MPPPLKYTDVISVIKRRIREGDYLLHELPGERRIAEDAGVSYMTARKAILELIAQAVLVRDASGKLQVAPGYLHEQRQIQAAFLFPAYPSTYLAHCRLAAAQAAERSGVALRPVQYVHWHDPVVRDSLAGADAAIVMADTEPMPDRVLEQLKASRVVMLDADLTAHRIPSITLFPDDHIRSLLEHLWSLGHRRIACVNTQGHDAEIERRIGLWRSFLADRGGEGALWSDPAPAYHDPTPRAHRLVGRLLSRGELDATALYCTTQPAALGALRACWDQGVAIGSEFSVCTVNNEPTGRYICPSLTGLEMPDMGPILSRCYEWFLHGPRQWPGELLLQPDRPTLLKGESTAHPATPGHASESATRLAAATPPRRRRSVGAAAVD